MGSDLQFADEYVGVTGITVTTDYGPTQAEQFAQDPTSYILLGILAALVLGLVMYNPNKA